MSVLTGRAAGLVGLDHSAATLNGQRAACAKSPGGRIMSDPSEKRSVVVGLDSGSAGCKAAILDEASGEVIEILPYRRHHN